MRFSFRLIARQREVRFGDLLQSGSGRTAVNTPATFFTGIPRGPDISAASKLTALLIQDDVAARPSLRFAPGLQVACAGRWAGEGQSPTAPSQDRCPREGVDGPPRCQSGPCAFAHSLPAFCTWRKTAEGQIGEHGRATCQGEAEPDDEQWMVAGSLGWGAGEPPAVQAPGPATQPRGTAAGPSGEAPVVPTDNRDPSRATEINAGPRDRNPGWRRAGGGAYRGLPAGCPRRQWHNSATGYKPTDLTPRWSVPYAKVLACFA